MTSDVWWRDNDHGVFRDTILAAAERLGVQPLAVEKDYWVCEALRAITTVHPGEVVFKGGTSLEKLRIIRRFSEDLDLLVIGEYPSKNLNPPLVWRGSPGVIANPAAILVELGQSGGPNPRFDRTVSSLLSRELDASGFDINIWADLAPFTVAILHPGRTLVEKLLRVNNFATNPDTAAGPHGWPRIGRQLYDIHQLLRNPDARELLGDSAVVAETLASARAVSEVLGKPDRPVPGGGFAASPAFDPAGSFAFQLREEHEAAMRDLYYGTDEPPTFDEILVQIHADAALLDI